MLGICGPGRVSERCNSLNTWQPAVPPASERTLREVHKFADHCIAVLVGCID